MGNLKACSALIVPASSFFARSQNRAHFGIAFGSSTVELALGKKTINKSLGIAVIQAETVCVLQEGIRPQQRKLLAKGRPNLACLSQQLLEALSTFNLNYILAQQLCQFLTNITLSLREH